METDVGVPDTATAPKGEGLAFPQGSPGVYPETLGDEDASAHTHVLDPAYPRPIRPFFQSFSTPAGLLGGGRLPGCLGGQSPVLGPQNRHQPGPFSDHAVVHPRPFLPIHFSEEFPRTEVHRHHHRNPSDHLSSDYHQLQHNHRRKPPLTRVTAPERRSRDSRANSSTPRPSVTGGPAGRRANQPLHAPTPRRKAAAIQAGRRALRPCPFWFGWPGCRRRFRGECFRRQQRFVIHLSDRMGENQAIDVLLNE